MSDAWSESERERWTAELAGAFERLEETVDLQVAAELWPSAPQAVLTTSVVVWRLVLQRMPPDLMLEAAVKRLWQTRPALGSPQRQARQQTLSSNTGGDNRARGRLDVAAATWLAEQVSQSQMDRTEFRFAGQPVFLIDGTTIALAPGSRWLRNRLCGRGFHPPPTSLVRGAGRSRSRSSAMIWARGRADPGSRAAVRTASRPGNGSHPAASEPHAGQGTGHGRCR